MVKLYCKALAEETTLYNSANLTTMEIAGRLVLMELAMKGQVFYIDFTLLSLNSQYNKVV